MGTRIPKNSGRILTILSAICILFITFGIGPDKSPYYGIFERINTFGLPKGYEQLADPAWNVLTYVISKFCLNDIGYFLVLAVVYVYANAYFCKFQTKYYVYTFIAVISFMGFYSYGINTIRAGVAISFLLIAMVKIEKSLLTYMLLSFVAIAIHKSVAIPAVIFLVTTYWNKPNISLCLWLTCLVVSFLTDGTLKDYVVLYLGDEDERIENYIGVSQSEVYQVGFRWDFIIYSILPIIVGYYHISKALIRDEKYIRLFNTYVLTNAFWLIVITASFSDRFAYLSWFLYPYILLLPFYNRLGLPAKTKTATLYIVCIAGFNVAMTLMR